MPSLLILKLNAIFCSIILCWLFYLLSGRIFAVLEKIIQRNNAPRTQNWPKLTAKRQPRVLDIIGWSGLYPKLKMFWLGTISTAIGLSLFSPLSWLTSLMVPFLLLAAYIMYRSQLNKKTFIKELPEALDALTKALQTGYTMPQAFELVAKETRGSLKEILKSINRSAGLNMPLTEALTVINKQIGLAEWELFHQALLTHQKIGGNLIPVLSNLSNNIRQNIIIKQEVSTATAAGRISAIIIAATTPALIIIMLILTPGHLKLMFNSVLGQKMLIAAVILQVCGYISMRRIAHVRY